MRKIPLASAVIAVLGLAVVGLTGCTQSGASACPRPVADASLADLVTVSDDVDAEPDVELYTPLIQAATASEDVVVGEGNAITTDAQMVVVDLTVVSGVDGEPVLATGYDGSTPALQLQRLVTAIPGLSDGLHCATEGSRVVIALAPGDISTSTAESMGLAEGDSAVAIVDLRQVYLARADGADVFNSGNGLPSVVRDTNGRPGLVIPDSTPPTDVVVQTIKRGDGAVVTGDVPVRVHYTGVVWATKEQFQTTWDAEPASVTLDGVVPGFAEALRGQTVGSQVMVVIPPSEGYGDEEQGAIPANSTLVFVIDILGLDSAPAE